MVEPITGTLLSGKFWQVSKLSINLEIFSETLRFAHVSNKIILIIANLHYYRIWPTSKTRMTKVDYEIEKKSLFRRISCQSASRVWNFGRKVCLGLVYKLLSSLQTWLEFFWISLSRFNVEICQSIMKFRLKSRISTIAFGNS